MVPNVKEAAKPLDTEQSAPGHPPGLASHITLSLEPNDARHLAALCGQLDSHLRQIEKRLDITIQNRSNHFELRGAHERQMAASLLSSLYTDIENGAQLSRKVFTCAFRKQTSSCSANRRPRISPQIRQGSFAPNGSQSGHDGKTSVNTFRPSAPMTSTSASALPVPVKPIWQSRVRCARYSTSR